MGDFMKKLGGAEKTFVVSGASSGIGRWVAKTLLDRGFGVLAVSRRLPEIDDSDFFKWVGVDLERSDSSEVLLNSIAEAGLKNIVGAFSNAGSYLSYCHESSSVCTFEKQFSANFYSHLNFVSAILPSLQDAAGLKSLVFTTTDQIHRVKDGGAAYAAAKSALHAYSRSLAVHLAPRKIVVTSVAPGGTDTPLYWATKAGMSAQQVQGSQTKYPSGSIADPEEVASFVVDLLTKPKMSCVGAEFRIDGGLCCL
ncbi:SDR family NAD(P)-dependent oxidoreductase [Uliginosibacterium sp. 31-12]|uniref:SDR family NAD(P)-dependent oxidoreductase n=1 Tax=Uliginosibacterium sp. 31-12 TaxID=3062781 RepID=UPI0026E289D9|nr:SDR family oxidoreductase [Uliginosibacterium sp. 31-12]MDO6388172.1 SDR family oxidoreductase [Uliginosibacterium sp. 31-12]